MLAVLSPAKALDLSPLEQHYSPTQLHFEKETQDLIKVTKKLKKKEIQKLMHLSDKLTELNFDRFQCMSTPFTHKNAYMAAMVFNGDVYKGLDARSLDSKSIAFAQQHLGILSGLYGLLRPLDLIQAYRLEMGTKLANTQGADLYKFWGSKISKRIDQQLENHQHKILINLASNEYFKAVDKKALNAPIITCVFEDWKLDPDEGKTIGALAKNARGVMARYVIEHRIKEPEQLKDFKQNRYCFVKNRSTDEKFIFSRKFISVLKKPTKK